MTTRALPVCNVPALDASADTLSWFEFWSPGRFYAPVIPAILWLSLRYGGLRHPLASNPGIEFGGLVGESKKQMLDAMAGEVDDAYLLPHTTLPISDPNPAARKDAALKAMKDAQLSFPLVAKPDKGCRGAGVQLLNDEEALKRYLSGFPSAETLILQHLAPGVGEAGVFYVRPPGSDKGHIFSLTLKYFPIVEGDGRHSLKSLMRACPRVSRLRHLYEGRLHDGINQVVPEGQTVALCFSGSHAKGAIFRDGKDHITDALTQKIDRIARTIPGFHVGRFDVRFEDFAQFRRGEGFKIIEVNGCGAEATHIWDSRTTLRHAYATLYKQWRWLYRIGRANRRAGAKPASITALWRAWRHEAKLTKSYPPTS